MAAIAARIKRLDRINVAPETALVFAVLSMGTIGALIGLAETLL